MSTVSKLEIHGIRSFGIHSGEEQRITFYSPLTLIVGQNGCGKTTIIECLKYGVTGDLPPNSDNGKSFVHNTRMACASEAIGKVKLQVKDIHGNKTTIDRSHKVTVKARGGKVTANAMNTCVTHETNDGKQATLTRRKEDATTEMCRAMGVSRAIINNVIFCHQEDSNWPLEGDAKVKKNFDEIFGTSDYNKVLEELNKKMKEREIRKKLLQEELKLKRHIKMQADQLSAKLARFDESIAKNNAELIEIEGMLKPIRDRIVEISQRECKASEFYAQEIKLKEKILANENNQKTFKNRITKIFEGDIPSLQQEIREFQNNVTKVKDENEIVDVQIVEVQQNNDQNERKIRKIEQDRIQWQQMQQQEQEKVAERAQFLQEIGPKVGVLVANQIENEPNTVVKALISQIKDKVKEKECALKKLKESHEEMDRKFQEKVNVARDKKTKANAAIATKMNEIKKNEEEMTASESQANIIEASATKIKDIESKIEKLEHKLTVWTDQQQFSEQETDIKNMKARRDEIQQEADALDEKIDQLSTVANIFNEIQFKEKQSANFETEFKRMKNKHADNLSKIFPNKTIERDFKREVQRRFEQLVASVKEMANKLNDKQRILLQTKAKHQHLRTSLVDKENELKRLEESIYNLCQSEEYDEIKTRVKEKVEKLRAELGANRASETLFKKYIADLSNRSCCPLCHNDMTGSGKDELIEELTTKVQSLPENVLQQQQHLMREERKLEDLLKLGPCLERVKNLQEDIVNLKEEIRKLDDTMKEMQSEIEDIEMCLAAPEEEKSIANIMLADMNSLDRFKSEIERLQSDINSLRETLPANQANENLEELKTRKKNVQDELRDLRTKLDESQNKLDKGKQEYEEMQGKRNSLLDFKFKLQETAQSVPQLRQRVEQLKLDIENARQNLIQLNQEQDIAKNELECLESEKQKEKEKNKGILDEAVMEKQQIDQLFRDVCRCNDEILQFETMNLKTKLEELKQNLNQRLDERTKLQNELKRFLDKSNSLKDTITKQEILERDLKENLDLKQAEREKEDLQKQLKELELNLGELDFSKLRCEKDRLQKEDDELVSKRSVIHGALSKEKEQAKEYRAELNKTDFKDSYRKYIETYHELRLIEVLISDIKQYRSALDLALTKYHQEKMTQINQSIRGLWQEIYRGNDIDYIEIRTEAPESGSSRRNFQYRVVQVKNNTELDMRGRCSAGQKVLASLIIRMALSETFSTNCAVMALDEPTTNLDQANIASLCDAIGRIIQDQQNFGHFSWIIITHDETFLQILAPYLEASYRVSRNYEGKSVITKID